ncbi:hypothetical protein B0H15DRAFT_801751 [Mycena belliarum]|uniref:Uncharacterized protein n=1 Tax=Mycena belliarum TaxID=1033014 RepID=A0AAD6U5C8_9AGAR|nr:hypothetical protein B0H15DRAFT_801751 [Mycena belliae]
MFANLSGLTFALPSGEPNLQDHTNFGRDPWDTSDKSSSDSGNDDDKSGDFTRGSNIYSRVARSSAPATLVSGQHRIAGTWHGELAQATGFPVQIMERLAEGGHGVVYAGALTQNGRGAVYAALKRMHDGGWTRNDVVDPVNNVLHNILWTDTGRPVLIDLVTMARHICDGHCPELEVAKKAKGVYEGQLGAENQRRWAGMRQRFGDSAAGLV